MITVSYSLTISPQIPLCFRWGCVTWYTKSILWFVRESGEAEWRRTAACEWDEELHYFLQRYFTHHYKGTAWCTVQSQLSRCFQTGQWNLTSVQGDVFVWTKFQNFYVKPASFTLGISVWWFIWQMSQLHDVPNTILKWMLLGCRLHGFMPVYMIRN